MNNYFTTNQQNRLNSLESQFQPNYGRTNSNVVYSLVNGYEDAKSFSISPGKVGLLFDSTQNEFYLKSVDSIGMQSIKKFTYNEIPLPSQTTPAIAENNFSQRLDKIELALQSLINKTDGEMKK